MIKRYIKYIYTFFFQNIKKIYGRIKIYKTTKHKKIYFKNLIEKKNKKNNLIH